MNCLDKILNYFNYYYIKNKINIYKIDNGIYLTHNYKTKNVELKVDNQRGRILQPIKEDSKEDSEEEKKLI